MQYDGVEGPAPARRNLFAWFREQDWLFAVALALAVGVVVWFGRSIKDFFGPSAASVMVPVFTGQTQGDATAECSRLQLKCVVIASQPSDRYPKDVVMSQAPAPGSRVREGRQVSLVVSTGVTIFPMPDLRFESLRNAGLDLNRLKLQLDKTNTVANDDVPANHIVGQDPPPLSSVRQGSKVSLTLSKGPPSGIKLPNFTGMDIDEARAAAQQARVKLGQIVWTPFGPSGKPRGIVVRRSKLNAAWRELFECYAKQHPELPNPGERMKRRELPERWANATRSVRGDAKGSATRGSSGSGLIRCCSRRIRILK